MIENIAIFGVSGVGKSTLIEHFIANDSSWTHLQAGQLIRSELKNIDHDKLRLEGNEAILKNQYLMIDAFWREIENQKLTKVIFDGHSIIDTGTEILNIPEDVIKALKPTKLLFIKVEPSIILDKRSKDTNRDRPLLSEEVINKQQEQAIKQFSTYGEALFIEADVIEGPNVDCLKALLS
jgi:adenylate kinase